MGGHRKVINNRNRLYGQINTPKWLHKQGIITAQMSYLRRRFKQTNGKEDMVIRSNSPMEGEKGRYTSITCITFPRESRARYIQPGCICTESREVADDNTNHRGVRMVFLTMNPINTWKNPVLMRTTTHYVERFQRMPSNSDDLDKRNGE